jgi:hypothetical protein
LLDEDQIVAAVELADVGIVHDGPSRLAVNETEIIGSVDHGPSTGAIDGTVESQEDVG